MFQSHPILPPLLLLSCAVPLMFGGMRLIWAGAHGRGLMRGALLALPIVGLAIYFTCIAQPGMGIALLLTCSIFMLTLGVGSTAINLSATGGIELRPLRIVLPLCLMTCLVGFDGHLKPLHAAMLLAAGALAVWCASEGRSHNVVPLRAGWIAFALPLIAAGLYLIVNGSARFQAASGAKVLTPLTVLLVGPAALIGLLGLFGRAHGENDASAVDTLVGFVITCLGFGQSVVILTGSALNRWMNVGVRPHAAVVMPIVSWRIDSVLLVVLSIILLPATIGRWKLRQVEGFALVVLYLIYANVAIRSANLGG